MIGTVKALGNNRAYVFLKTDKADYFLHKDDFDGHWDDLVEDFDKEQTVTVEFTPSRTEKGLRAKDATRIGGNY